MNAHFFERNFLYKTMLTFDFVQLFIALQLKKLGLIAITLTFFTILESSNAKGSMTKQHSSRNRKRGLLSFEDHRPWYNWLLKDIQPCLNRNFEGI